jgi:hypothetical protein
MEERELLDAMTRVKAPAGFEESVLNRLPAARKARARARRHAAYRYAFAGSAALMIAGFLFFNPSLFEKETVLTYAERAALTATPGKGRRRPTGAVSFPSTKPWTTRPNSGTPSPAPRRFTYWSRFPRSRLRKSFIRRV